MPRVIQCEGCQQSHLIRDELIGRRVLCDCGRAHTVPSDAPAVPAPTGLLDAPVAQVGSVGLLLVSVLVLGGVIAWVVGLDAAPDSAEAPPPPVTPAPATPPPVTPVTDPAKSPDSPRKPSKPDDPRLLAALKQLKDPDLETNAKAIEELKKLEDDAVKRQAIPEVVAAIKRQDDEDFRQAAATWLQLIGSPLKKDYPCLKDALQVPHPPTRRYAMSALKDLGDQARDAMDVVVEAMKHRDAEVQRDAAAIMKNLGPTARAPAFRLLLNPSSDADEEASLGVLKTLLPDAAPLTSEEMDALTGALRDAKRRTKVRLFAVDNLGKGEQAAPAVSALLDVLGQKCDDKLLARSIEALGRIGDKRKEVLAQLLAVAASDRDEKIRLQALHLVRELDSSTLSAPRILERWTAESSDIIRQELDKMLHARLTLLKREKMSELVPLLGHKEAEIVLVALKVVQDRKEEAAGVAVETAALLKHMDAKVRVAALNALEAIGSAVESTLPKLSQQLLDHWPTEKDPDVRQALTRVLRSRLMLLKREQMQELRPLLGHEDTKIVLLALGVVRTRKEEAAGVAAEVAGRLKHGDAKVRVATLEALQALSTAADKVLPNLSQLLVDRWPMEKAPDVREALLKTLRSRLLEMKREKMRELVLLLGHKEPEIILVALKVVQERKNEAADVAEEVAGLLEGKPSKEVRKETLAALKALGSAADKAFPKLFEILDKTQKNRRTPLALTVADMIDAKDAKSIKRLVPFLIEGLHPKALAAAGGTSSKTAINKVLLKIGQPAVDGSLESLSENLSSRSGGSVEGASHRRNLYEILVKLGPPCQSKANYEALRALRNQEANMKFNDDLIKAAAAAMKAMDDE